MYGIAEFGGSVGRPERYTGEQQQLCNGACQCSGAARRIYGLVRRECGFGHQCADGHTDGEPEAPSQSVAVQLNAATAALSLNATSLSFGNVAVGTAVTKSVTVTSSGTVAVNLNSDSISGTGYLGFGRKLPCHPESGTGDGVDGSVQSHQCQLFNRAIDHCEQCSDGNGQPERHRHNCHADGQCSVLQQHLDYGSAGGCLHRDPVRFSAHRRPERFNAPAAAAR